MTFLAPLRTSALLGWLWLTTITIPANASGTCEKSSPCSYWSSEHTCKNHFGCEWGYITCSAVKCEKECKEGGLRKCSDWNDREDACSELRSAGCEWKDDGSNQQVATASSTSSAGGTTSSSSSSSGGCRASHSCGTFSDAKVACDTAMGCRWTGSSCVPDSNANQCSDITDATISLAAAIRHCNDYRNCEWQDSHTPPPTTSSSSNNGSGSTSSSSSSAGGIGRCTGMSFQSCDGSVSTSCLRVEGCQWSSAMERCYGGPTQCEYIDAAEQCDIQGCTWEIVEPEAAPKGCITRTKVQTTSCGDFKCSPLSVSGGCNSDERELQSKKSHCNNGASSSVCYFDVICCDPEESDGASDDSGESDAASDDSGTAIVSWHMAFLATCFGWLMHLL